MHLGCVKNKHFFAFIIHRSCQPGWASLYTIVVMRSYNFPEGKGENRDLKEKANVLFSLSGKYSWPIKATWINYVSRNQLHSTEFLLSIFEFERQNIAGCRKQTFCFQFNSEAKHDFSVFSVAYWMSAKNQISTK